MTVGACTPSDCSDSSLSRLAFPSVCLRLFVSFLFLPRVILYLVSLSLSLRPFGARRRLVFPSLSLPLSLSHCRSCRIACVILCFVFLSLVSLFVSSVLVRLVRVCTLVGGVCAEQVWCV